MRQAERLPLTPAITERATRLMETLALSHGLQMGDALIAATGLEHQLTVLTANTKHDAPVFSMDAPITRLRFWPGARRGPFYRPVKKPSTVRIDAELHSSMPARPWERSSDADLPTLRDHDGSRSQVLAMMMQYIIQ
jgi:hypothetical protein